MKKYGVCFLKFVGFRYIIGESGEMTYAPFRIPGFGEKTR